MTNKIVVFGGNIKGSKFLELKKEADVLGVDLDLVSYKEMGFRTENGEVFIADKGINDYDVYFFRSAKKYWEEISLILDQLDRDKIVIDPVVKRARPSDACKAYQMLALSQAGIPVPKSVYGSLGFLVKKVKKSFEFPLIIKGSRGDRRRQVFKLFKDKDFNERVKELKEIEKSVENKYMLQEYIENTEDYRVMVVGSKVLGVMRRKVGDNPRLKNIFEKADLPDKVKNLAVEVAKVCGLTIAGVDVVFRDGDFNKPLFYEANKTPNYDRLMEVTGINVASEIVKFLAGLEKKK
jgi:RimK family alpha-L-glutamate ligase